MSFYYFTSLSPPFPMDNACVQISLFLIMFHISSFPPYLESHKRKPSKSRVAARVVKNWVNKYQVRGVKLDRDGEFFDTLFEH